MHNRLLEIAPNGNYDPTFFSLLFSIEDRHFWFRTRNHIISKIVTQITQDLESGYNVLEVGCGTGNVLRFLELVCQEGRVTGMDLFSDGLRFARQRVSCQLVQADMHSPPYMASFDVVGLFDVLEHLPNDDQVLCDLHSLLKPGGALLLTVPAHMSLWSYFDTASHHCRRYGLDDLRMKLKVAGFQVTYITYYMAPLFPLLWLGRRLAAVIGRRYMSADEKNHELAANELQINPVLNGLLALILSLEFRFISRRWHLPTGTSLLCLAYKSSTIGNNDV